MIGYWVQYARMSVSRARELLTMVSSDIRQNHSLKVVPAGQLTDNTGRISVISIGRVTILAAEKRDALRADSWIDCVEDHRKGYWRP
jgi:hypothetical protein